MSRSKSCFECAFLLFPNAARPFVILLMVFELYTSVDKTWIGFQVGVMLSFLPEQSGVSRSKAHCSSRISLIYLTFSMEAVSNYFVSMSVDVLMYIAFEHAIALQFDSFSA